MNRISIFATLIGLMFTLNAVSQKIKLTSGSAAALKGEKNVNVVFTYDGMGVGAFKNEQDYIDKKKKEYNAKEAGKGDKWEQAWLADRKNRFEPQFVELYNKNSKIIIGDFPDAKYTLVFNTTFTEPGFNVGVVRKNAMINGVAKIIETTSKKQIGEYSVMKAPGRTFGGYDFDSGLRIQEAYAVAGKVLGKTITSATKK